MKHRAILSLDMGCDFKNDTDPFVLAIESAFPTSKNLQAQEKKDCALKLQADFWKKLRVHHQNSSKWFLAPLIYSCFGVGSG